MDRKLIITLLIILCAQLVNALPEFSHEFYGEAWYFNENVSSGRVIRAYYDNNSLCGSFNVQNFGKFGLLSCIADDPETSNKDGASILDTINFTIDGFPATAYGDYDFESGEFSRLQLTVPQVQCGDGFCDNIFEYCDVCIPDCGTCPEPPLNGTTNTTGNETSGDDGSGSSSSSSSSSGGSTGSGSTGGAGGAGVTGGVTTGSADGTIEGDSFDCRESWQCTDWSDCTIENVQERDCTDTNNCGTRENKPDEVRTCDYYEHCYNGIKDSDELGLDCGGSCEPCSHCVNGVQDEDEEGIDCGGTECNACASCFDEIQNQGEEGIDCGGPCEAICPEVIQRPGYVCAKSLSPVNTIFLAIVLVLILSDFLSYLIYNWQKDRIEHNKKLTTFQKAAKKYHYKKIIFAYIISTLIASVMILLYYWFFGVCEDLNMKYLWVLLVLLGLSYFVIAYLIKLFEFNEKKKIAALNLINNAHYKNLEKIIEFHKKKLDELAQEINKIILYLMHDKEFITKIQSDSELGSNYKQIVKVYMRKAKQNPFTQEESSNDLEDIKSKIESEKMQKACKEIPQLNSLIKRIQLMIEQYDEMSKAEEEKTEMEKEVTEEPSEEETNLKTQNNSDKK